MTLSDAARLKLLEPPVGKVRVVLDTDTYNEIDDQFALVQMLLSKDRFDVEAIYAAPFFNTRADSPGHGMELSYQEILRLLERLNIAPDGLVHRGVT
ncbi:nucleoside hydrolase-like domain-containing protein, partial [Bradyrhizobium japonicum]